MGKSISIEKEIKIMNAKRIWGNITDQKPPYDIDLKDVEKVDGSGLQLIIFLFTQAHKFPEKYRINGLSDKLKDLMNSLGYKTDNREVVK